MHTMEYDWYTSLPVKWKDNNNNNNNNNSLYFQRVTHLAKKS